MAKRTKKKAARTPATTKSTFESMSVMEVRAELTRRERGLSRLIARRDRMLSKIEKLTEEIRESGGDIAGGLGKKRPRNESNLVDALAKALTGKTMNVSELAERVQAEGYRTTSPSFRVIVNQTLIKSPKFKRVGRGQYAMK